MLTANLPWGGLCPPSAVKQSTQTACCLMHSPPQPGELYPTINSGLQAERIQVDPLAN